MACMFCPQSRKSCKGCGAKVCAKHSASNGCCVPCLERVAAAAAEGRITTQEEDDAIEAVGGDRAALYGEITPVGVRSLAARLQLSHTDQFADLGSGLGRACFQAVEEYNVARSVGVEMAGSRHHLAEEALEREHQAIKQRVHLVQGDCAEPALWAVPGGPMAGVTVVFMGSLMFSAELMHRLAQLAGQSSTIRAVATLKRFGEDACGNLHIEEPAEICETSWTIPSSIGEGSGEDGTPVFIYTRR